jgi:thiamine biosynthesis protein ThiI
MERRGLVHPTFKVTARRSNKSFPHRSLELNRLVGGAVLSAIDHLSVDVHHPDINVHVEVREREAFVWAEVWRGPGGLPVGASGPGLLLLSGGIDSPVAGWMAMKRGIAIRPVHFDSFPFTSERARQKVYDLCQVLTAFQHRISLTVVPFAAIQTDIQTHCPEGLRVTIMRRMMLRIASALAERDGICALVTGESVGQVASQTLESIYTINAVTNLPILRPLVGFDKEEIIARAQRIGTYDISVRPYEDCCTVFVPQHPKTKPHLGPVERAEKALDVSALVRGAVAECWQVDFTRGAEPPAL